MKTYWDSSALVEAAADEKVRRRLIAGGGITRTHSLSEVFSTLTKGQAGDHLAANMAAQVVAQLAGELDFCDLTVPETLRALSQAEAKGVRGGRVHDYLHAVAAHKGKAGLLLAADKHGFDGLFPTVELI
jgi:hypothetical protein